MESYLFSFQMMHTSQFQKIDPYGPGHICFILDDRHLLQVDVQCVDQIFSFCSFILEGFFPVYVLNGLRMADGQ